AGGMFGSLGSQLEKELEKPGPVNDILSFCEEKSGIHRRYIVYCMNCVKAIESPSKDDDTQWLIYWVVFASLQLFEACTLSLVYYLPLYPLIKVSVVPGFCLRVCYFTCDVGFANPAVL
ncbi:receptor expression-enhancing protein 5/6, partial [Paragonimus westermani]